MSCPTENRLLTDIPDTRVESWPPHTWCLIFRCGARRRGLSFRERPLRRPHVPGRVLSRIAVTHPSPRERPGWSGGVRIRAVRGGSPGGDGVPPSSLRAGAGGIYKIEEEPCGGSRLDSALFVASRLLPPFFSPSLLLSCPHLAEKERGNSYIEKKGAAVCVRERKRSCDFGYVVFSYIGFFSL